MHLTNVISWVLVAVMKTLLPTPEGLTLPQIQEHFSTEDKVVGQFGIGGTDSITVYKSVKIADAVAKR